jgi:hypothetical protein
MHSGTNEDTCNSGNAAACLEIDVMRQVSDGAVPLLLLLADWPVPVAGVGASRAPPPGNQARDPPSWRFAAVVSRNCQYLGIV